MSIPNSPKRIIHTPNANRQISQLVDSQLVQGTNDYHNAKVGSNLSNRTHLYHIVETDGTDKNDGYEITLMEEDL